MKQKMIITGVSLISLILSTSVQAGHKSHRGDDYRHTDRAKVVHVEPIVRYVKVSTPEQSCWKEPVTYTSYDKNRATGNTILGGIIGAAIGNNIGHGKGRKQRAIAGAIIGSVVASQNTRRPVSYREEVRYENQCETTYVSHTEERIDGYNVTYKYHGQRYTTRMPYHPGKFINVRVDVDPVIR